MAVVTHTYTATLQTNPRMANHSGVSFARGRINLAFGATGAFSLSGTEVVRCYVCKIPAGATILDWWGVIGLPTTHTGAGHSVVIGLATDVATTDVTITHTLMTANTSISASAVVGRFTATAAVEGYGLKVSVSDDQQNQHNYVVMTATLNSFSGTATASLYADLTVMYTMDNQAHSSGMTTVV